MEKARQHDNVIYFIKKRRFEFINRESKKFLSLETSFTPIISLDVVARVLSLVCYAILREIGIAIKLEEIVNAVPIHNHLRIMAFETAAEVIEINRRKREYFPLFLSMEYTHE